MAHLEHLISRYLDGDLTSAEHEEVRRLIEESPEARAHLRELTAVARAARRMPLMHRPNPQLELQLFQRLASEGLYKPPVSQPAEPAARRVAGMSPRRWHVATAAFVAMLVIVSGISRLGDATVTSSKAPIAALAAPARANASNGTAAARPSTSLMASADVSAARPSTSLTASADVSAVRPTPSAQRTISSDIPAARGSRTMRGTAVPSEIDRAVTVDHATAPSDPASADTHGMQLAEILPASARVVSADRDHEARETSSLHADLHHEGYIGAFTWNSPDATTSSPAWAASLRGGVAQVAGDQGTASRDVDMKLGLQLADRHQLSVIVGVGPTASATSLVSTGLKAGSSNATGSVARGPGTGSPTADGESEFLYRSFASEPWVGVGYNYSMPLGDGVTIDPGIKGGAGRSTIRLSAELPIRYRMSSTMSIEAAAVVARVIPSRSDASESLVADASSHVVFLQSTGNASFTSYGVQLGVRIDIGGH